MSADLIWCKLEDFDQDKTSDRSYFVGILVLLDLVKRWKLVKKGESFQDSNMYDFKMILAQPDIADCTQARTKLRTHDG